MSISRTLSVSVSVLLASACNTTPEPPDLTEALGPDQVRAGVIVDEASRTGGSSAEAQPGDLLLINDRVRFVVQAARNDGNYHEAVGGNIIDADIVRPAGEPGRDLVDEWAGMYGLGRLGAATRVEVIDDGVESGEAIVRATGVESPLTLFTGATENPGLVQDLGLKVVTDYILRPGTTLLEVRTTLSLSQGSARITPGDLLQGGLEGLDAWDPGVGLQAPGDDDRRLTAYIGRHNELAYALVPEPGQTAGIGGALLLSSIADLLIAFQDEVEVTPEQPATFRRFYGVGADLADITDAVLALDGTPTTNLSDVVQSAGAPVAGARVHVLVEGEPFSVAVTDAQGRFAVDVPQGADVTLRASGQLDGITRDLPTGWAAAGPYTGPDATALALSSLSAGAPLRPAAEGYGLASVDTPLTLPEPASLTVATVDGAPFEVRVYGDGGPSDPRLVTPAPSGVVAMGWAKDGEITLPVPAGSVRVEVHRGLRFERDVQTVALEPGQSTRVDVTLAPALAVDGWILGDPHSHAGPSPDGLVAMEDRLLASAAVGLQVHFGTDHDHIVDYTPLLAPLGLQEHLKSVMAVEFSPVLRGHLNAWPVERRPDLQNGGAVRWWSGVPETTDVLVADVERLGPDTLVQANHPRSGGIASSAGWARGRISKSTYWTDRLSLIEVNNDGSIDENVEVYLDLISRGYDVVPVAVSDAHGPTSGGLGLNATFFQTGGDLSAFDDQALIDAVARRATVASRGPFLQMSVMPGSTVVGSTELTVQVQSASWVQVDRLILMRGPQVEQVVDGTQATFTLAPERDDVFTVIAEGDTPMGGPYGSARPWALASPIYVDVAGDGWTPPLAPLEMR